MADKLREFGELLDKKARGNAKVHTLWATVSAHNPDGTFDCVAVRDGLDYYDVLPGLGAFEMTPAEHSKVLIGIIEGSNEAFLLAAAEVDEIRINGKELGGLVKAETLKSEVDKNTAMWNALLQAISTPVTEPGNGAPSALQAALQAALSGRPLADLSDIENETVKHG